MLFVQVLDSLFLKIRNDILKNHWQLNYIAKKSQRVVVLYKYGKAYMRRTGFRQPQLS